MNREKLIADLVRDEGLRLKPYRDTVGKTTIGIGRNLDDVGISAAEARHLCENDVARVIAELDRHTPWWGLMDEPRQRALANMCFNLGWPRLSMFKHTLQHLAAGRWNAASVEMLDSLWAKQVGARAQRIAALVRGEE